VLVRQFQAALPSAQDSPARAEEGDPARSTRPSPALLFESARSRPDRRSFRAGLSLTAALLFLAPAAHAQERIAFANDKVSLAAPQGFARMSREMIDKKFPRGNAPEHVFSNAATTVSVAGGYTPNANLTRERLPEFKTYMEGTLERTVPGLKWIARDIVDIAGQPWIRLEFRSNAIDTEIHNIMLMTDLDGGMAGVNFNSTVGEYEVYRARLAASEASIRVQR
jgi:hypothetical protein